MTDNDPYGGLPSLERLEGEVRELAVRSHKGWVGRNWRRLTALGAVLAVGVAVSPAGPAFGGPDAGESEPQSGGPTAAATCPDFSFAEKGSRRAGPGGAIYGDCTIPACPPLERIVRSRPEIAAIAEDLGPQAAIEAAGCEPSFAEETLPRVERAPSLGATGPAGPVRHDGDPGRGDSGPFVKVLPEPDHPLKCAASADLPGTRADGLRGQDREPCPRFGIVVPDERSG